VFNYWEPLHFLVHGHGLQTWEYAGPYALRSYLYLLLHAPVVKLASLLSKPTQFYALRGFLGVGVSALCEAHWLDAVHLRLGHQVAAWALFFMALSPGLFIASAAFIPSSFAMACLLLCQAAQLRSGVGDYSGGVSGGAGGSGSSALEKQVLRQGFLAVLFGATAVVVGWPFCVVALLPTGLDLVCRFGLPRCITWGLVSLAVTALPTLLADSYFYDGGSGSGRGGSGSGAGGSAVPEEEEGAAGDEEGLGVLSLSSLVFSTGNLVAYNMFPRGTGSELYGTEPWPFYFKNLGLNFGPGFPAALCALPLLAALAIAHTATAWRQGKITPSTKRTDSISSNSSNSSDGTACRLNCLNALLWASPFYLWLTFMTALPHKEERFMFPVYPQLCLAASAALTIVQTALLPSSSPSPSSSSSSTQLNPKPPPVFGNVGAFFFWWVPRRPARTLKAFCLLAFAGLFAAHSLGRTAALASHYGAPLKVYSWLSQHIDNAATATAAAADVSSSLKAETETEEAVVVCVGKEWYRFPSHFLLNSPHARLAFVKGGFNGQLPRPFDSKLGTKGPSRSATLSLFNEMNAEQVDRYVDPTKDCDFVVDLGLEDTDGRGGEGEEARDAQFILEPWHHSRNRRPSSGENANTKGSRECDKAGRGGVEVCGSSASEQQSWELLHTEPFLDAANTPALARIFLLPQFLSLMAPSALRQPKYLPYEVWRNNNRGEAKGGI
jgi:alpha-1,2-mannosyltransferase